METNTSFEINGIILELDLLDADVMEKYEALMKQVQNRVSDPAEYEECTTEAGKMRKQCRIVDDFFNGLFGDGTANRIFGGGNNLRKRLEAFQTLVEFAQHATDGIQNMMDSYSPQRLANREQRRAAQFRQVGGNGNRSGKKKNKTEWQ